MPPTLGGFREAAGFGHSPTSLLAGSPGRRRDVRYQGGRGATDTGTATRHLPIPRVRERRSRGDQQRHPRWLRGRVVGVHGDATDRVMQQDVLFAVLVEVRQPSIFPVARYGDRHVLRPPDEQIRPRHADKKIQSPVSPGKQVRAAVARHIPDEQRPVERARPTFFCLSTFVRPPPEARCPVAPIRVPYGWARRPARFCGCHWVSG